jgi:hypothetical protein
MLQLQCQQRKKVKQTARTTAARVADYAVHLQAATAAFATSASGEEFKVFAPRCVWLQHLTAATQKSQLLSSSSGARIGVMLPPHRKCYQQTALQL